MKNQQNPRDRNPGAPDQGQLPRRDRSNVDDAPDNADDRGARQDRSIHDPQVIEERRAPGAENAEDELDDEDFDGEEDVRR
jgi:hypothetical protein